MASKKTKGAAVIAAVLTFTAGWEGTDLVAKRDPVGTGHPLFVDRAFWAAHCV